MESAGTWPVRPLEQAGHLVHDGPAAARPASGAETREEENRTGQDRQDIAETRLRLTRKLGRSSPDRRVIDVHLDNARLHHAKTPNLLPNSQDGRGRASRLPSCGPQFNLVAALSGWSRRPRIAYMPNFPLSYPGSRRFRWARFAWSGTATLGVFASGWQAFLPRRPMLPTLRTS